MLEAMLHISREDTDEKADENYRTQQQTTSYIAFVRHKMVVLVVGLRLALLYIIVPGTVWV